MTKKKTPEEFLVDLKRVHGDTITTSDKYINGGTKMVFHCNKGLGHKDWKAVPSSVLQGRGCPECGGHIRLTDSQFRTRIEGISGISLEDSYVNYSTKLRFRCTSVEGHGYFYSTPRNILTGHGCPLCSKERGIQKKVKSQDEFLKELGSINSNIKVLSKYIRRKNKIKVECSLCGNVWNPTPNDLLSGCGCPNCASSSGEQTVRAVLEFNNINYDPQHNFKIKGKTHRLDFVLRDINNNWCVIQPDGQQHFKKNNKFYRGLELDRVENKYLPALGIRVLRIPWFWFDLDNTFVLLQNFLGSGLKKPNKDYIPMYKKVKEMVYDYLIKGDSNSVASKYKVHPATLSRYFKDYFGMSRMEYVSSNCGYKLGKGKYKTSVVSIDKDGNRIIYDSQGDASRITGNSQGNINMVLRGIRKTAGGYKWEYAEREI